MVALQPGTLSSQTQTKPSSSDVGPLDRWRNRVATSGGGGGHMDMQQGSLVRYTTPPSTPAHLEARTCLDTFQGGPTAAPDRGRGRRCGDSRGSDRKRA